MKKLLLLLFSVFFFVSCRNIKTTSSNSQEFTSLDRKTFQLYGDVTNVVTIVTMYTDKDGFATAESLSSEDVLNFDNNGNIILKGAIGRDEDGRIVYWDETPEITEHPEAYDNYDIFMNLHKERWFYLPNGNVSRHVEETGAGLWDTQYKYDTNNEILTLIANVKTEGDLGTYKYVRSYNILEKDKNGNWISRITKEVNSWTWTEEIIYRKEIRKITYK